VRIAASGDFKGLREEVETGQLHRPVSHAFHHTVISTALFFDCIFASLTPDNVGTLGLLRSA
jgi:hypothetical protein